MSDSFSPDGGQRIEADGRLTTPVRWTDPAGVLIGEIDAIQVAPGGPAVAVTNMTITAHGTPLGFGGPFGDTQIEAASIALVVGGFSVNLLDGQGGSDFARGADLNAYAPLSALSAYVLTSALPHDYVPIDLFGAWEPYRGIYTDPAFWVDPFGICHLRGLATNPPGAAIGTDIGAVPKPADLTTEEFIAAGSGPAGFGVAAVSIVNDPAGGAAFLRYDAGDSAPDAFVWLSGITYPTA